MCGSPIENSARRLPRLDGTPTRNIVNYNNNVNDESHWWKNGDRDMLIEYGPLNSSPNGSV